MIANLLIALVFIWAYERYVDNDAPPPPREEQHQEEADDHAA